ncbi:MULTISPECIES: gamma-mobile-trio protein GmtX [Pseudomonas]|uniref:Uncharacterized protein n=1 Tax=Pseudomonas quercus TaxID=2722792 RepID=A0ABX0YDV2_9PSED|nr:MULTISPECIES: gamma-mobile-trio protein GmtX [Pseudomonas]MBF7143286.1 hypothetical protein [Pseudomonas sp. LY10J]NJP01590.1 hypothetical protein [Pseudomonas quercus]
MSPEELLSELKAESSPKTCATLDAIFVTCMEEKKRENSDFSYARIARLGKIYGAPSAQSIRNTPGGDKYRALINVFASNAPEKTPRVKGAYAWIEELRPEHRFLVKRMLGQLKEANNLIKEALPSDTIFQVDLRNTPHHLHKLNDVERRALEYLLSKSFMSEHKLTLGPRSDMLGANGEQLFKPGTLSALQKALDRL